MSTSTPLDAFKLYTAIKNHFSTESYDYFKYNGKTRVTEHTLDTRKDKYMFYKLSKHADPKTFLVANLSVDPNLWVGNMFSKECEKHYTDFLKRKQSLTYIFKEEIDTLLDDFDKNFEVPANGYPHLLNLLVRKKVSMETFIIMQDCVRFFSRWNKQIQDPVQWPKISLKCRKLHPFLEYEKDKYCQILRSKFS